MNTTAELIRGHRYTVRSQRKGTFNAEFVSGCDTWATFRITSGKAGAMLKENECEVGEEVTVRRSLCSFTPL